VEDDEEQYALRLQTFLPRVLRFREGGLESWADVKLAPAQAAADGVIGRDTFTWTPVASP
jgi:hypothetical protein